MELELITTLKEAEDNARLFSDVQNYPNSHAFNSLGKFFHWYYFPNLDTFAPRKFIRYKRSSVEEYDSKGTGSDSSNKNMEPWFHKLQTNSTQYEVLVNKLKKQLVDQGKELSDKTIHGTGGIYVLNEEYLSIDFPDQITDENYPEGAAKTVQVNAYERNLKARQACIKHWGYKCYVCSFDFEKRYGELGKEFIHVHHIRELSSIGKEYNVDPINDLRPLCPNCHAMVHKEKPAIDPDRLKAYLKEI